MQVNRVTYEVDLCSTGSIVKAHQQQLKVLHTIVHTGTQYHGHSCTLTHKHTHMHMNTRIFIIEIFSLLHALLLLNLPKIILTELCYF